MPKQEIGGIIMRKNTCLEMQTTNPFHNCVSEQHALIYHSDDLVNPIFVTMDGVGESGFYLVDNYPTVYRRNYLKISAGLRLSCGEKQQEMIVVDQSGTPKKVTSFQAIAVSLDEKEVLKQYGPKRDKGEVSLLQRQYTIPQDLHYSRISYHRIQFKTSGKIVGSSNLHKMAISKAQIRFLLFAQVENEDEILVSSLTSNILVLRGRSQKYYDNLDQTSKNEVAQLLNLPFLPQSCRSKISKPTPIITGSLYEDYKNALAQKADNCSPLYNANLTFQYPIEMKMEKFQQNHSLSSFYDSPSSFSGEAYSSDYLGSPACSLLSQTGSILSPCGSILSPTSTSMVALSPFALDMYSSISSGTSTTAIYEGLQKQPGSLDDPQFNPLEISPDKILNDFFTNSGPETFLDTFSAGMMNTNTNEVMFSTPASNAYSPYPSVPTHQHQRPSSVPLLRTKCASISHHSSGGSKPSFLRIDTRMKGNGRFPSPLSACLPLTSPRPEDLDRVQSAPPTQPI